MACAAAVPGRQEPPVEATRLQYSRVFSRTLKYGPSPLSPLTSPNPPTFLSLSLRFTTGVHLFPEVLYSDFAGDDATPLTLSLRLALSVLVSE